MDYTYTTLTKAQAAHCKDIYARLLAISRMRRKFVADARATGWGAHINELWDAYLKTEGF